MDTYIVTARTVNEAIAIANAKYADDKHEVSCEVLEMPKKGFLGIGSKEAKIKVTVSASVSADLGSIVADMRGMKKYTDRGGDGQKDQQKEQNQQRNEQKQKQKQNNQNAQNNQKKNDGKGDRGQKQNQNDRQNAQNNQQKQKQQGGKPQQNQPKQNNQKPAQQNNQKNEQKPAQPAEKKQKSALSNSAKPNVRPQIKLSDDGIDASGVTVGTPMGLTDFVSENKQNTFGNGSRSGGSMSNDIRKKKPAKPMMPADKADEKMRASKYDVAESDEDYRNIDAMVREDEAKLEKEAGAALGFGENEAEIEIPAAEPRKKEPITQAEMDYALEFANTLLTNMNVDAKAVPCECPEGEDFEVTETANVYPKIEIIGDDTGILIGHHGETLDAIQYLVNLSALRKTKSKDGDYVKIVVDTENYREKRAETLKSLARRMAAKAVKYKRNVFLEPMNAYERRIIHSELQSYPDVSTHSVGSDRDRKIIITYEGADKQTENRSRRRRRGGSSNKNRNHENKVNAADPADSSTDAAADYAEYAEHRAPKKIQKVSIDQINEVLEGKNFLDGE